ncbi:hypothetical protein IAD21_03809 [Abditibacteriota bacterium]|nr:hypothetical protein IAD21_03809 [Abditibacteriota bacterium]
MATFFASVVRQSAPLGQTARLRVPGYADFVAAGGKAHFFVGTTNQEITSAITSATGWTTSIAPGQDARVRVEISVPITASPASVQSLVIQTQDGESGATPIIDAVRVTAVVSPRAISDLMIRESNPIPPPPDPEASWVGKDIVSSLNLNSFVVAQSLSMMPNSNAAVLYDIRVKNVGNLAGAFALALSAPPEGWTHSLVTSAGDELTAQAPDHWLLPSLEPGHFLQLLLTVQPVGNIAYVPPCVVDIQAKSGSAHDKVALNLEVQHIDHLEYTLDPGADGKGDHWQEVPATGITVPQWSVLALRAVPSNPDAPWPDDPFKPQWTRGGDTFWGDLVWLHCPEATATDGTGETVSAQCNTALATTVRVSPVPEADAP